MQRYTSAQVRFEVATGSFNLAVAPSRSIWQGGTPFRCWKTFKVMPRLAAQVTPSRWHSIDDSHKTNVSTVNLLGALLLNKHHHNQANHTLQ